MTITAKMKSGGSRNITLTDRSAEQKLIRFFDGNKDQGKSIKISGKVLNLDDFDTMAREVKEVRVEIIEESDIVDIINKKKESVGMGKSYLEQVGIYPSSHLIEKANKVLDMIKANGITYNPNSRIHSDSFVAMVKDDDMRSLRVKSEMYMRLMKSTW